MKCQLCEIKPAEFGLYATFGTVKVWLELCDSCDRSIGEANLLKLWNDMPLTDGRLVGEVEYEH